MMRFQAAQAAPSTTPTTVPTVTPTTVGPSTTPTTAPPRSTPVVVRAAATAATPTTVTANAAVPATSSDSEHGQATWYAAAPAGRCASPTLPFGTVLTVTNVANGASTRCTVDDREQAGYPRVVDLSPSGFAQLASTSQGVVDVTISW